MDDDRDWWSAMPVSITTQKVAQVVRRELQLCYLCGRALPRQRRRFTEGEHVIPIALLRSRRQETGVWPLILDVHPACHLVKGNDELEVSWHSLNVTPRSEWDASQIARVRAALGPGELHTHVWPWIRGLHAALYLSYLPPLMRHQVFSPSPEAVTTTIDRRTKKRKPGLGVEAIERGKLAIKTTVALAGRLGRQDTIILWNRQCKYSCVWADFGSKRRGCSTCWWILELPGYERFAEAIGFPANPWSGMYEIVGSPPTDARVTIAELSVLLRSDPTIDLAYSTSVRQIEQSVIGMWDRGRAWQ